jgi:hypothetical protein
MSLISRLEELMEAARKQAWEDAYHHAFKLVGRGGVETSLLAVGMMWAEVFEITGKYFFQKNAPKVPKRS